MPSPLDAFISHPDIRERFQKRVAAPHSVVMGVAENFDLQSLASVRAIFRLREVIMRADVSEPRRSRGLLEEMTQLGWGVLERVPGRLLICGAVCQPWQADVEFTPIPATEFAAFSEPGQVKIAWSLEADPLSPTATLFAHETRAVATDPESQARFRCYWRWARFGIVAIRLLVMPAIRRQAERRFHTGMKP